MADEVYCDICGRPIAPAELREGRAVRILNINYCPRCKAARDVPDQPKAARRPSPPRPSGS